MGLTSKHGFGSIFARQAESNFTPLMMKAECLGNREKFLSFGVYPQVPIDAIGGDFAMGNLCGFLGNGRAHQEPRELAEVATFRQQSEIRQTNPSL